MVKTSYFDFDTRSIIDVDEETTPGVRRICRINVPWVHRGQGHGSLLMSELCRDADEDGVTLVLEPMPYDGPERLTDLLRFYARFGFTFDPNEGCTRLPH